MVRFLVYVTVGSVNMRKKTAHKTLNQGTPPDLSKETAAIQSLHKLLKPFSKTQQQRMIAYVWTVLHNPESSLDCSETLRGLMNDPFIGRVHAENSPHDHAASGKSQIIKDSGQPYTEVKMKRKRPQDMGLPYTTETFFDK